jgi:hypothetical protein
VHSRFDARPWVPRAAALLLVVALATSTLAAAPPSAPPSVAPLAPPALATPTPAAVPTDAEIAAAVKALNADPNLGADRKISQLHWVQGHEASKPPKDLSWGWLEGLLSWIAQAGRVFVWVACVVIAGVLAIVILRLIQARNPRDAKIGFIAPTHVRDLDIRPESLPADIPAAAMQLWQRGEHRAALALLYRGTLSRMAHVHSVPVVHSNTEGEIASLAAKHLPSAGAAYVADLIRMWQRAVYRHDDPTTQAVQLLCDSFEPALAPAAQGVGPTPNASPAGAGA